MTEPTSVLWELLTAAGGTLALTLIIRLALGINALTLLFVGSAAVTLERCARVARRARSMLGSGLVWAALVVVMWDRVRTAQARPERRATSTGAPR